ncbi:MAG: YqaJ viral recombinase family protein [Acholeplasmataceae bacterium]|nr:YqaJ viral recombinase family protein [Acholeplasmataceae bacterium]
MAKTQKLYKRETFTSRDEWLSARGMGGSSASAILGVNPWMSKLELYKTIVAPAKFNIKKDNTNEAMAYGIQSEPLIRKEFILDHPHLKVLTPRSHEMFRRTDKPYLTATIDGRIIDKATNRKGVLEIKTRDIRNRADDQAWQGQLPQNYFIQVIHYLMVLNDFDFAVVVAKLRFFDYYHEEGKKLLKTETRYYHIERSEVKKDIENLEKVETHFWEHNVEKRKLPKIEITF